MVEKIVQISEIDANSLYQKFDELQEYFIRYEKLINRPTDILLTRKEVAGKFSVSLVTIHDWTNKNILKSYKIGNRVYYKQLEVDKALTEIVNRKK